MRLELPASEDSRKDPRNLRATISRRMHAPARHMDGHGIQCQHMPHNHSVSEQTRQARTPTASRDMTKNLGNTGNKPKITT